MGRMKRAALLLSIPAALALPAIAEAQSVNPYLPMTTKPPGPPQNPALVNPGDPIRQRNMNGVIAPPPMASGMPVIHPRTPSRMPVIPPPGTPGGNPTVIPK